MDDAQRVGCSHMKTYMSHVSGKSLREDEKLFTQSELEQFIMQTIHYVNS